MGQPQWGAEEESGNEEEGGGEGRKEMNRERDMPAVCVQEKDEKRIERWGIGYCSLQAARHSISPGTTPASFHLPVI